MCNPALLVTLKENVSQIEDEWTKLHNSLAECLSRVKISSDHQDLDEAICNVSEKLDELKLSEERKL